MLRFVYRMRRLFLYIALGLTATGLNAQRFDYIFNRITTDDGMGLRVNNIHSIYRDAKGFIWIGNSNGLQRFDGSKFVSFDPTGTKPHPMPAVTINKILPAPGNCLWLAAYGAKQFGIFNPSKFRYESIPLKTSQPLPPRAEFNMWQDVYQNTYINVLRYGKILMYDSVKKEFNENTPLNNIPPGWKTFLNVFHDKLKKQYWITTDHGLCIYDEQTKQMWSSINNPKQIALLNHPKLAGDVTQFYIDAQRRHWVFNWTGIQNFHCFDSTGRNELKDTTGLNGVNTSYAELNNFYETNNGSLWIYGLANLYAKDKNKNRFTLYRSQSVDNSGIRYENINQVYDDRDGVIWIATDEGLYYTAPGNNGVINLFLSNIPGKYNVTDILELKSGEYWLSTWGETVLTLTKNFQPYPSPLYKKVPTADTVTYFAYRQVWAMHQQSTTGKVFLGCQRGQLMIFDTVTQQTQYLHPPEMNQSTIRSVTQTKTGEILFGTQGGRLIKYDGLSFKVMQDLGAGAIIYKILVDDEGLAWLGTQDKGIYAIHPSTGAIVQHYTAESNKLFSASCADIEQLNSDLIVCATSALTIINKKTKQIETITVNEGLPSNSVQRLRLDADGFLWLITDNGLCRYDYKRKMFTTYGKSDGVLLANIAKKADYLCNEKFVMFAGVNSLLFFQPGAFKTNRPTPDVMITDFFLGDSYQLLDSLQALPEIILKPDQNDFTITFACLDFKNRNKYIYYYQMKGLSKEWIRSDERSMIFTGLAPGHYVFRVKAVNVDGVESKSISELRIYIKPPFWRTAWFISTLLTIIAMIAYGMHRLRIKRILAVEKIRNRVARDLHDDMGSTLSTINILSSMAKAKLNSDAVKTGEYINKISDNSQRMMEAMDDIVWAIKPANDSMQKVVGRMREFATSVFEAKDIELDFKADEGVNDVKINMEARRDFFLIFKEAVNNAAKYSKCEQAAVHVFVENNKLKLLVKDNGIGFDVKAADSGNGLGNMQKRAGALKGKLEMKSEIGTGTEVMLTVPLN
jgi:signal transduction histidine kinase/ligand-binding sensor domain-containing protein